MKGFEYAVANGCPLSASPGCTKISISLPVLVPPVPEEEEGEAGIGLWEPIYLVPGGRYLITADEKWLCIWDLEDSTEMRLPADRYMLERTVYRPKQALKLFFNVSFTSVLDIRVAPNDEIHVLAWQREEYVFLVDDPQSRLTAIALQRGLRVDSSRSTRNFSVSILSWAVLNHDPAFLRHHAPGECCLVSGHGTLL